MKHSTASSRLFSPEGRIPSAAARSSLGSEERLPTTGNTAGGEGRPHDDPRGVTSFSDGK